MEGYVTGTARRGQGERYWRMRNVSALIENRRHVPYAPGAHRVICGAGGGLWDLRELLPGLRFDQL